MKKRRKIPTRERVELFNAKGGVCHLCGGKVHPGEDWDISHVIPLELNGADDLTNWDVAHRKCHRVHTAEVDQPMIAKAKRQEAFHIGAKSRGSGFNKAEPQRRASKPLRKWYGYKDLQR